MPIAEARDVLRRLLAPEPARRPATVGDVISAPFFTAPNGSLALSDTAAGRAQRRAAAAAAAAEATAAAVAAAAPKINPAEVAAAVAQAVAGRLGAIESTVTDLRGHVSTTLDAAADRVIDRVLSQMTARLEESTAKMSNNAAAAAAARVSGAASAAAQQAASAELDRRIGQVYRSSGGGAFPTQASGGRDGPLMRDPPTSPLPKLFAEWSYGHQQQHGGGDATAGDQRPTTAPNGPAQARVHSAGPGGRAPARPVTAIGGRSPPGGGGGTAAPVVPTPPLGVPPSPNRKVAGFRG